MNEQERGKTCKSFRFRKEVHMHKFACFFSLWWSNEVCFLDTLEKCVRILTFLNPMRPTCWLAKIWIWSSIEPITECVRKNSLICKFVIHCYQTCFMIGSTNDHTRILTNHIWCSSVQGVNKFGLHLPVNSWRIKVAWPNCFSFVLFCFIFQTFLWFYFQKKAHVFLITP